MKCPPEYGVKQFVAVVRGSTGTRFMVFNTGSARHYFFQPVDAHGCAYAGAGFPVLKSRLRDDVKRALASGRGNAGL